MMVPRHKKGKIFYSKTFLYLWSSNLRAVNAIVLVRISVPSIRRWITKIATCKFNIHNKKITKKAFNWNLNIMEKTTLHQDKGSTANKTKNNKEWNRRRERATDEKHKSPHQTPEQNAESTFICEKLQSGIIQILCTIANTTLFYKTQPKSTHIIFTYNLLLFREMEGSFAGTLEVWFKYMLNGIMDWLHRWLRGGHTKKDRNSTWLSLHSCCCFVYLYSQMPRLSNWTKGSQQLLPLGHTCILHNPMEKEKAWVSQANYWTNRARSYSLLEEPKASQFRFE